MTSRFAPVALCGIQAGAYTASERAAHGRVLLTRAGGNAPGPYPVSRAGRCGPGATAKGTRKLLARPVPLSRSRTTIQWVGRGAPARITFKRAGDAGRSGRQIAKAGIAIGGESRAA
jgi:hypothetical protein